VKPKSKHQVFLQKTVKQNAGSNNAAHKCTRAHFSPQTTHRHFYSNNMKHDKKTTYPHESMKPTLKNQRLKNNKAKKSMSLKKRNKP